MNQEQRKAAEEAMAQWLAHPQELGKRPAKIECAGEFDLKELHYYIFKYKKSMLGKWLLGVCGGYEGDALEHCGHVFSEMQVYTPETAQADAEALVETVRTYWMEQAQAVSERKEKAGSFVYFILLKEAKWDKEEFFRILSEDWGVQPEEKSASGGVSGDADTAVFSCQGSVIVSVALMPAPVPDGEAEHYAAGNYMWKDAVTVTKQHQAHLVAAVMGGKQPVRETAELMVKIVAACCKQQGVLGVYGNQTVYQPEFYLDFSAMLKQGMFPLYNLVFFGMYKSAKGICGYTCGMNYLGYDEIEIIDSSAKPEQLNRFLVDTAAYVINENVILRDGETIGFSAEQKLPITKSRGVAVKGDSLKIGF